MRSRKPNANTRQLHPDTRGRKALLLKRRGKLEAAQRVLKDLLDGAKLGPAHYRRAQAQWLDRARRELS